MHGCVLRFETQTILILANGGMGKSSLAAESLARGFPVLCDDNFLVWQNAKVIHCTTFEEEFCIQKTPRLKIPRSHFAAAITPSDLTIDKVISLQRGTNTLYQSRSDIFSHLIEENPFAWVNRQLSVPHFSLLEQLAKKWRTPVFLPEIAPFNREKLWEIFIDQMGKVSLE